jgi:hypothetical protein
VEGNLSHLNVKQHDTIADVPFDAIELSIFGHRFMSIAE